MCAIHSMAVPFTVQIFVKDNQTGTETTQIDYIGFLGSPVSTTNMGEFKRVSVTSQLLGIQTYLSGSSFKAAFTKHCKHLKIAGNQKSVEGDKERLSKHTEPSNTK